MESKRDIYTGIIESTTFHYQAFAAERDELLQLLQKEVATNEALRQKLEEEDESNQCIAELQKAEISALAKKVFELENKLEQIKDENSCCICLEPWQADSDHRRISLYCGHLFGECCIREVLSNAEACPVCHQQADSNQLHYIYGPENIIS
ncbi:E3 ubiquitin-protein ligase RNF4-like [Drosophila rhopaloa]|uniref:E3 ubiquitin-protein ligase RNF4-like n=1 Tax=Drosophila rhopaloa TaxID=1041015 RepID=A0A6P4EW83_DRORH|nr:E3 ubiquitin-protein ligase RNF4-like [Drosophila rhopaloa]